MKTWNIIQGDCVEVMGKLNLPREKYIVVTDPPFNIGYHYKNYKDRMEHEQYYSMIKNVIGEGKAVIIHYPEQLHQISIEIGQAPERVVAWVYNSNTGKQHRDVAFYRVKPDFNKVRQPYKNPNDKRIQKRIAEGKTGAKLYDWWEINQIKNVSKEKTEHPCQMPEEVMRRIIGILPEDYIIIDPFMGSGTTGVACKKLNRAFIGIDIDPDYCEIARRRIDDENNSSRNPRLSTITN